MPIIDCHCHLLPEIDDGAIDQSMMVAMAKVAVNSGTQKIVVTPHHGNGVFSNAKSKVMAMLVDCQRVLNENSLNLTLYPGSELHLTPELVAELETGSVLTYADQGKAILVELPKQMIPIGTEKILSQILDLGIVPIIAHPERNGELLRAPEIYQQWVGWGCKGQLTGMSVNGRFGKPLQTVCDRWIRGGYVHIIASDAHRPVGRSPDMSKIYEYVSQHYGESVAHKLLFHNPNQLLTGKPLLRVKPIIEKPLNQAQNKRSISSRINEYLGR